MFTIWSGDEVGLLKKVEFDLKKKCKLEQELLGKDKNRPPDQGLCPFKIDRYGSVDRNRGIQVLETSSLSDQDDLMCTARYGGLIEYFDTNQCSVVKTLQADWNDKLTVGIHSTPRSLILGCEDGRVNRFQLDESDPSVFKLGSNFANLKGVKSPSYENIFATGGKEEDLCIWDISRLGDEKNEPVFKAKNVPYDFLDMRVPIWVTNFEFLKDDGTQIITGTGHHQLRIYDTKAKRRPVVDVTIGENPVKAMTYSADKNIIVFSDTVGNLTIFDLRKNQMSGKFGDIGGNITDVKVTSNHVISCCMDRKIRIHELEGKRKLLDKIYTKQRLTQLVVVDEPLLLSEEEWEEFDELESLKRKR